MISNFTGYGIEVACILSFHNDVKEKWRNENDNAFIGAI